MSIGDQIIKSKDPVFSLHRAIFCYEKYQIGVLEGIGKGHTF